jgi:hypothetical protein
MKEILFNNRKASTVMEYMTLVVFLLGALLVFQQYIVNGFSGQWKQAGDVFSHGKQYDPRLFGTLGARGGSMECFYDFQHCRPAPGGPAPVPDPMTRNCLTGYIDTWIDQRCYRRSCDCTLDTDDPEYHNLCLRCLANCRTPECGSTTW